MTEIGFIGIGTMGRPMVRALLDAGHGIKAFDIREQAIEAALRAGATRAASAAAAARGVEVVVSMLPEGPDVRSVYLGPEGVIAAAVRGALLIDCSTIDLAAAREVHGAAAAAGLDMLDAPVSGTVSGEKATALTFMVGGGEPAFARGKAVLAAMGKTIVHVGPAGAGQAAKMCNNMLCAIIEIGLAESFALADRVGLEPRKLFEVLSSSAARTALMASDCPVPGLVADSPASRGYQPGFRSALMLKDLGLAHEAATGAGAAIPLGRLARLLYARYCAAGNRESDWAGIYQMIRAGQEARVA